jgi:elongation factor P
MAKIDGNKITPGMVIEHQGTIWKAVKTQAVKPGKGGAFAQVELKNLIDGRKLNERFRSADSVERVRLEQKDFQYLFDNGDTFAFMDQENYEQTELSKEFVGEQGAYLQDGMVVRLEFYQEKPIGLELPQQVTLEITETEPVVKGQTAANSFKPATLENGVRTSVPPFVGVGEKIVVNTEDGAYVKRAD